MSGRLSVPVGPCCCAGCCSSQFVIAFAVVDFMHCVISWGSRHCVIVPVVIMVVAIFYGLTLLLPLCRPIDVGSRHHGFCVVCLALASPECHCYKLIIPCKACPLLSLVSC